MINKAPGVSLGLELCLMTLVIRLLSICFSYSLERTFKIVFYMETDMHSFYAVF